MLKTHLDMMLYGRRGTTRSRRRQTSGSTSTSQCVLVVVIGALLVLISLWFNLYSSLSIDLPHNDAQIKGSAASNEYFTEYVDTDVKVEKTSATAAVSTLKNYNDEREREVDNMISTNEKEKAIAATNTADPRSTNVVKVDKNIQTSASAGGSTNDENEREADEISTKLEGTSATVMATAVAKKGSSSTAASVQCLDLNLNQGMDSLVGRARQIFVTMPAKGGGSSMNVFTRRCNNETEIRKFGFIENDNQTELLVESMQVKSIITSHVKKDATLIRLAKYPSQKTLMIHIHREEGERVISGVKMISYHMCKKKYKEGELDFHYLDKTVISKNETHCILDEGSMVDWIAKGHREVGKGTTKILTCKLYDALQENAPQLVFLNYKQIDKLQTLLAKHHCPELLDELPIKENVANEKKKKIFLHDGNENKDAVRIEDWLEAKGPLMEWALNLRSDASCQAKTVHMEDELFGCPDEALKVTSESIKRW